MAYGIRNLQRNSRFDLLTPGRGGGYGESDVDDRGAFGSFGQQSRPSNPYDPDQGDVTEASSKVATPPPSGLAKLADVSMDPDKDDSGARLKEMIDIIQGSYHPDVYSRNRNDRLLDNFPERRQPTKMDRFTAALMSVGQKDAGEITERVLQGPYHRERADWIAKTEPFYKAAQLEGTANTQERQVLGNAITGFSAAERNAQAQRTADQRYELGVQRLQIDKFKAEHPDWKYDTSGPRILAFDPLGGPPKDLGPTGRLTELEKLNIQGTTARDVATIGANSRTAAAEIRANAGGGTGSSVWYRDSAGGQFRFNGSQTVDPAGNPYEPQGEFNKIPTEPRDPMDTAANQAGELKLKMGRVYATEEGRRWLIRNNDGSYTPKARPTPGMFSNNAQAIAEYDRVMKAIWPDYQPNLPTTPTPNVPAPPTNNQPPPAASNQRPPAGPLNPRASGLQMRARQFLEQNKQPVTQANIDHAIKMGWVK